MKLVYLWIKDCKNIHEQGILFDKRYKITAEYADEILTLKARNTERKSLNIFGDRYNITALVGRNGAGKSAVLEALNDRNSPRVIIVEDDGELFYIDDNKVQVKTKIEKFHKNKIFRYFYHPNLDKKTYLENIKKTVENFYAPFDFIKEHINFSDYVYQINVLKIINRLVTKIETSALKNPNQKQFADELKHNPKWKTFINESNILNLNVPKAINVLIIADFIFWSLQQCKNKTLAGELKKVFASLSITKGFCNQISKFAAEHDLSYKTPFENDNFDLSKFTFGFNSSFSPQFILSSRRIPIKNFISSYKIFNHTEMNDLCEVNFLNACNGGVSFNNLSNGEKAYIIWASYIYADYINHSDSRLSDIILIDEGETYMHPEWQRHYIDNLTYVLDKITEKAPKFKNIILTTHSPFILSDMPRENVIYMENGKEDHSVECKSFGANIYELLNNGFYLNSPLGEFATKKINELIIKTRESRKLSDEDKRLIDEIGEPIIRNQLLGMIKNSSCELKELEEENKRLKKELSDLRRKNNV